MVTLYLYRSHIILLKKEFHSLAEAFAFLEECQITPPYSYQVMEENTNKLLIAGSTPNQG